MSIHPKITESIEGSAEWLSDALQIDGQMLNLIEQSLGREAFNEHGTAVLKLCRTYLRMVNEADRRIRVAKERFG